MSLEEIFRSDRLIAARKALNRAFENYVKSRRIALSGIEIKKFKEKLRKIREVSIENMDSLVEKSRKNLETQGIETFEAKNAKEALKILKDIFPENELITKSKSNVLNEIGFKEEFKGRNKILETDCGDFIVQICEEKGVHPVTPAIHIPLDQILETIEEKFGVKLERKVENITGWIRDYLRRRILEARFGLTGANVVTGDGAIFIVENEGNISLVSRLPETHVIVTGIDKIAPTIQEGMMICKALAIWGTGSPLPAYINVISSPSKTADVEKKMVYGMHGARNVKLIFVDNGRRKAFEEGLEECLYCINCGSCLYFCPVYREILDEYGYTYFGGIGIAKLFLNEGIRKAFERGLYFCTTCLACKINCPVEIDVPKLIRKIRNISVLNGLETDVNKRMIESVEAVGNPFGEEGEGGEIPEELFCC